MSALQELSARRGRFLHIIPDDKFIDAAHGVFEDAAPGANDYIHLGTGGPLRKVRTFQPLVVHSYSAHQKDLMRVLPAYSGVLVHYLSWAPELLVAHAPAGTKLAWLGWGRDYYKFIRSSNEFLLPKTRCLIDAMRAGTVATLTHSLRSTIYATLNGPIAASRRTTARRELRRLTSHRDAELSILNRFQLMATPIPEDHAAMCASNPAFRVPYVDWNYWTPGFAENSRPQSPSARNILLGNSATPENNHIDALALLPQVLPVGCKIICPLSYGDARYADAVERAGRSRYGERFIAVRKFMDTASYTALISSCAIVVMNHIRQQALGNIILALWNGAYVFLNAASPINTAMQRLGISTHDTEDLQLFLSTQILPPGSDVVEYTRKKLRAHYGRPAVVEKTRALLEQFN